MDPRSVTFSFLLPLFAFSGPGPTTPYPASSPSPSPSPSTVSPPVHTPSPHLPPPAGNRTERPPGPGFVALPFATSKAQLNVGEKVGLAFLSVVLVLQLALGGFLIFKRLKLRNMALVGRRIETPSPAGSP